MVPSSSDGKTDAVGTSSDAPKHTINGTLDLPISACSSSSGGYSDIGVGTPATVTNEKNEVLGQGSLEASTTSYCTFTFKVTDLQDAVRYGVTVSDRGTIWLFGTRSRSWRRRGGKSTSRWDASLDDSRVAPAESAQPFDRSSLMKSRAGHGDGRTEEVVHFALAGSYWRIVMPLSAPCAAVVSKLADTKSADNQAVSKTTVKRCRALRR